MVKRCADFQASEDTTKKAKMATPMNVDSEAGVNIDEDLHSRQLAVYGKESMKRMANASVLIVGVKGLGVEVGAKPACWCCHRLRRRTGHAMLVRGIPLGIFPITPHMKR